MPLLEESAEAIGKGLEKATPLMQAVAVIGVTYVGWQIYQRLTVAGDAVGGKLGEWWGGLTNPDIVEAQIRLKSNYFMLDGELTPEAKEVIESGYPNLYRELFDKDRIKPQYAHLVDSGEPLKDSDYA